MIRIAKSIIVVVSLLGAVAQETCAQRLTGPKLTGPKLTGPKLTGPDLTGPKSREKPRDPVEGDAAIQAIAFPTAQIGIAVGDRGAVWRSEDGGQNWVGQSLPTDAHFTSVYFLDQRFGWISGEVYEPLTHRSRGVIFRTADGGRTWNPMTTGMLPAVRDVHFFSPREGIAVGESSTFFPNGLTKTKDGGLGWTAAAPGGGKDIVTRGDPGARDNTLGRAPRLDREDGLGHVGSGSGTSDWRTYHPRHPNGR